MEDEERGGAQSSRARSPIGGEGVAPMGQYLGPASPFSVGLSISLREEVHLLQTRVSTTSDLRLIHTGGRIASFGAMSADISQFIRRASRRFGNLNAVSTTSAPEEPKSGVSIFSMGDRQLADVDASSSIPNAAQGNVFVNRYFGFFAHSGH